MIFKYFTYKCLQNFPKDHFSDINGFTGIFLIATCSATLSSFSTFLSSSATVILPLVKKCRPIEDDVKCSKILIVIVGLATFAFAVGSNQLSNTLMGMLAAITVKFEILVFIGKKNDHLKQLNSTYKKSILAHHSLDVVLLECSSPL